MTTPNSPRRGTGRKTAPNQSINESNDDRDGKRSQAAETTPEERLETNDTATVATEDALEGQSKTLEDTDITEKSNPRKESKKRSLSPRQQQLTPENSEQAKKSKVTKYISRKEANNLLIDSGDAINSALKDLAKARALANRAGLSVDSRIIGMCPSIQLCILPASLSH